MPHYRTFSYAERGQELEVLAWGVHAELLTTPEKKPATLGGRRGWLMRRSIAAVMRDLDADLGANSNVRQSMTAYLKASHNLASVEGIRGPQVVYWVSAEYAADADKLRTAFTTSVALKGELNWHQNHTLVRDIPPGVADPFTNGKPPAEVAPVVPFPAKPGPALDTDAGQATAVQILRTLLAEHDELRADNERLKITNGKLEARIARATELCREILDGR